MPLQVILNGLVSGLVLAVLALGFSLVYLPCRVFHIALGGVYALVPYVTLALLNNGQPWVVAIAAGLGAGMLVSLLCEAGNHARLERRQASEGAHLISSLGIFIIIVEVVVIIWGNEAQVLRSGVDRVYRWGTVMLTRAQLLSGAVGVVLLAGVLGWLWITALGLRLRALADNPIEFALCGYNVNAHRLLVFGMSGLLASIASLLTAYDVGFEPHGGLNMLVLAVVAVIIGGRESFRGPILGGILLGMLRALVVWHFSAKWQDVATFLLLAAFLYVRPRGICGRTRRLEAET